MNYLATNGHEILSHEWTRINTNYLYIKSYFSFVSIRVNSWLKNKSTL